MSIAFVFPGQGSQQVGMGRALAEASASAREVFDEVDEALGQKLSSLMWEGPEDALTLTENAQPALMAVSLAVVRTLMAEHGIAITTPAYVAGHSLGEYSALAAAGTFGLADAARLLKLRGQAMQRATPVGVGAMAALIGLDYETAAMVARDAARGEICQPANDNAPGQIVLSGHRGAVERAVELAKARGARRALMLTVSAPFHCTLMQPAAEVMAEALETVDMKPPVVPLMANVTARALKDPAAIRAGLVRQVTATVRWRECVSVMANDGVSFFAELGSGKVLSGLAKRIAPDATAVSAGTPDEIAALASQISAN
ncbi:MAG TPA: ACP S-malonyltransferase [Aestuariivirgaceae bacterium]|nr:ACP S-malonyltransferase [Aestuariivirgaceae bacterium]